MINAGVFRAMTGKLGEVPSWILFILGIVIIGNLVSLASIGIHPDEAYYWTWAVYPDFSYYDHPPMVGWMIWLVDRVFGISDLTLRLPALFSWAISAWLVFSIATRLFLEKKYGWLAVTIFCLLPVFQAASHIVTPDSPLLLFTALAYYFLLPAANSESKTAWLFVGAAVGFAFLSKYNAVLIPMGIFAGLLFSPNGRMKLLQWRPWAGFGIAALLFAPVVYWNFLNDWISFSYQLGHGVRSGFRFDYLGIYLGGQLGAALIWVFVAMVVATYKVAKSAGEKNKTYIYMLVAGFWIPLVFFGYAGSTTIGEVNWPAMAYLPGSLLLAGMLGKYVEPRLKNTGEGVKKPGVPHISVVVVLLISGIFSVLIVNIFRFPVESKSIGLGILPTNTQLSDTFGWGSLKSKIINFRQENYLPENCNTFVSTRYIWTSMSYQFNDVAQFSLLPGMSTWQHDLWASRGLLSGRQPCMVIERLSLDKTSHRLEREWEGLGSWVMVEKFTTPTSDTPRIYGFYLPKK